MESAEYVPDSDELLAEAANRMEMEFWFSQTIPDESLIDAVERLESDGVVGMIIGDDRTCQQGNSIHLLFNVLNFKFLGQVFKF